MNKSKIFKTAWAIFKNGFASSLSQALKKAYLITKMSLGLGVSFSFAKESGEYRLARALQVGSLETISRGFVKYLETVNGITQWRSFKIANLLIH